jgi:hypothetical protein
MAKCYWACGRQGETDEDVFPNWLRAQMRVKKSGNRRWRIEHFIEGERAGTLNFIEG